MTRKYFQLIPITLSILVVCAVWLYATGARQVVPRPARLGSMGTDAADPKGKQENLDKASPIDPDKLIAEMKIRWPGLMGSAASELSFERLANGGVASRSLKRDLDVKLPRRYDRPVAVRGTAGKGAGEGITVQVEALGARASELQTTSDGRHAVFREVYEGTNVVYRRRGDRTEEYLHIKRAPGGAGSSEARYEWRMRVGGLIDRRALSEGRAVRLTEMNSIEFLDAQGVPRMRIDPPRGMDANGKVLEPGREISYEVEPLETDEVRVCMIVALQGAAFPILVDPSWSSTGSLAQARASHTAILLANGETLVAGGVAAGGTFGTPISSCELFNPISETWRAAASLSQSRGNHETVLLDSGKVIVIGGEKDSHISLSSCELYDSNLDTWAAAAAMASARYNFRATKLSDGRILASGGQLDSNPGPYAKCEIYDPNLNSWSATGDMGQARYGHACTRLNNGTILACGGNTFGPALTVSSEIFNVSTGTWSPAANMNLERTHHQALLLQDGRVFVHGGELAASGSLELICEFYKPSTNQWNLTGSLNTPKVHHTAKVLPTGDVIAIGTGSIELFSVLNGTWSILPNINATVRQDHTATVLTDGRILVAAGYGTYGSQSSTCNIFDASPEALSQTVSTHVDVPVNVVLGALAISSPVTFTVVVAPKNGNLSGTSPNLTYTPNQGFLGQDSFTFQAQDGAGISAPGTVTVFVSNNPPTVQATASPTAILPGSSVGFYATGSDPDGDTLTYSWIFGDGTSSSEQNPAHVYEATGVYEATVTVSDEYGASGSQTISVAVGSAKEIPVARFTTSDVVGFVGHPLAFDATFSTDPENAIVQYLWDFGDGSPIGTGQLISRTYGQTGTYSVTLTIMDAQGYTATTVRRIEVLPEDQVGLFNASLKYKVKWDRNRENRDGFWLNAIVNVGDAVVEDGTPVVVEIADNRFVGTLDGKLRDRTDPSVKWKIKTGLRNQSFGELMLNLKVKRVSLGLGFNLAGVVAGSDLSDDVLADVPLLIEIGERSFEVLMDSEFEFRKGGTKAKGNGEGP